jgi:hypothetical protein
MRPTLRLILFYCLALASIPAHAQPAPGAPSVGVQAVGALIPHLIPLPKNPNKKTGQQLSTSGHWSMANGTPAPCSGAPPGSGACVRLIYTVPDAGASCEWVVLLKDDGSDVTILDENDDAAHYFLVKLSAAAARQLLVSSREPVYPPIARAAHVEGNVKLQILVSADGKTTVDGVTGPPMLTATSTEAARDWRLKPLQIGNRTVPYQTEIVFHFGVSGRSTGMDASIP